ncbi:hypothetical protein NPIL_156571 [Nephila pilipes]|uniref:Uncharacterized protein n=1 Tax=Nephila pilipes TaxID=299642 RepID=A0A8X6T736_NEPPI|nr:hypothetical protein NPIL_156571 [Nephila pilipes]
MWQELLILPTLILSPKIRVANTIVRYRLGEKSIKKIHQIYKSNANREIVKTTTGLETGHFDGMKINADHTRTYKKCRNCPEKGLTPEYIFTCLSVLASSQRLGEFPFEGEMYCDTIVELAGTVMHAHGSI